MRRDIFLRFKPDERITSLKEETIAAFREFLTDEDVIKYSGRRGHASLAVVPGYEAVNIEPIIITFDAIGLGESAELGSLKRIIQRSALKGIT